MKTRTHPNESAFPDGVPGPALRALAAAGIRSMGALTQWSERDLAALHGMGPKALGILRTALRSMGLDFRSVGPERPAARPARVTDGTGRTAGRGAAASASASPRRRAIRARMGATTVEEYLARLDDDQRNALEDLRRTIKAAAPDAEECVTYGIPAFRLNGMLVGFGAAARHCAFYLMSGATVEAHRDELAGFDTSKGTIRFTPSKPLPKALVRKLVKARIAENRD